MPIKIISIGRKHEAWVSEGIERYQKRLRKPFDVMWLILPNSHQNTANACQDESGRILAKINQDDYLILLDDGGTPLSSENFSTLLTNTLETSKNIVFVIGGAYGVDDSVINRANFILSLSLMVFPHQLARLILIEQLYRAQEIVSGHPYHHQ